MKKATAVIMIIVMMAPCEGAPSLKSIHEIGTLNIIIVSTQREYLFTFPVAWIMVDMGKLILRITMYTILSRAKRTVSSVTLPSHQSKIVRISIIIGIATDKIMYSNNLLLIIKSLLRFVRSFSAYDLTIGGRKANTILLQSA